MIKRSKPSFSTKDQKPVETTRRCHNIGGHIPHQVLAPPKEESQVSGVPTCLQRILSFTGGHMSTHDKSFVKVHLANGTVNVVRCMDDTRIQDVIDHVVEQHSAGQKSQKNLYSVAAVCGATKAQHWFHRDMSMSECHRELLSVYEAADDWRFELKIRFFLKSRLDLLLNDRIAFDYLFEQVKNDFKMGSTYETLDRDIAVELASIEIRMVLRDKHQRTPGKKISNTVLEEVDWKRFLPKTLLSQGSETKLLFKSIQKVVRSYLVVSEEECILKYFDIVSAIWRFDMETFDSFLGDRPSPSPVRLTVAQAINITHENESTSIPLVSFDQVESVSLSVDSDKDFGQLMVSLLNGQSPLTIKCSSAVQVKQLASLIDGNCFLLTAGRRSVWSPANDGKTSIRMTKITEYQNQTKTAEMPDYAILEEDLGNTKSPLINRSLNCHPVCSCSKATDVSSPLSPFASTPDLLSNARSPKFRPGGVCTQDVSSCGLVTDKVTIGHPSVSLCNVAVNSQADKPSIVSKLTHEVIEQKLRLQKQQSDDDAEWLHREEAKLILGDNRITSPKKFDQSDNVLNASKIHCDGIPEKVESSNIPVDLLHQVKVDRSTDPLYCATTALVQGIVDLNGSVQQGHTDSLVGSAKTVGMQLKALLNAVHLETSSLPSETQDAIEMAQKTLNSDLVHLIDAMKMVIRYSPTELSQDYRRSMLQLGHALAVDAKTLLDTVDQGRKKKIRSAGHASSSGHVTDVANQMSVVSLQSDLHSSDQLKISQSTVAKM